MKRRKRLCLLLCGALLAALFSGCHLGGSGGKSIRFDLDGPVEYLDPQFATDPTARMILANLYEGLMVQRADGSLELGAAASYTLSPDGLTYTFTLREGLCWSDGVPLVAEDFVFSFRRMFAPGGTSPYAAEFVEIKNAAHVLQGSADISALGVYAPDEHTVVFELEERSAVFLELLSTTAAVPCSREQYEEARGRYGLERQYVYSNGPFELTRWNNSSYLTLTRSEHYVSDQQAIPNTVQLYVGREDPFAQFLDGKSDVVALSAGQIEEAQRKGAEILPFDKTVWCLVFNQERMNWGNALLRQGLAHTIDPDLLNSALAEHFTPTDLFVPPAMMLENTSYRDLAGSGLAEGFDPARGARLFQLGLEMQELSKAPTTIVYVPDSDGHALYMGLVQQGWQKHLNLFASIEIMPLGTLESRLESMDYQIMLIPFSPSSPRPSSLLGAFHSDATDNYTGYRNERYDLALEEAVAQPSIEQAAQRYAAAEQMLLSDAAVIPLYFETSYYAVSSAVTGIEISPFAGQISFKYAQK